MSRIVRLLQATVSEREQENSGQTGLLVKTQQVKMQAST